MAGRGRPMDSARNAKVEVSTFRKEKGLSTTKPLDIDWDDVKKEIKCTNEFISLKANSSGLTLSCKFDKLDLNGKVLMKHQETQVPPRPFTPSIRNTRVVRNHFVNDRNESKKSLENFEKLGARPKARSTRISTTKKQSEMGKLLFPCEFCGKTHKTYQGPKEPSKYPGVRLTQYEKYEDCLNDGTMTLSDLIFEK